MTKRAAEEASPSLESSKSGPDLFGYYKAQIEELLSQEEFIPHHEQLKIIGADFSELTTEKLNALLRQCVLDLSPEVDEMQSRVLSMHQMLQLKNKKQATIPTNPESVTEDPALKEVEEDLQFLMRSDPSLVEKIVSKHLGDLFAKLNDMQQQLEKLLDSVVTTCRPMSRSEIRDLQKSIKELPGKNLKDIARIIKNHYIASGKEFTDKVMVNLEEEDSVLVWRLHFHVGAVEKARKLAAK